HECTNALAITRYALPDVQHVHQHLHVFHCTLHIIHLPNNNMQPPNMVTSATTASKLVSYQAPKMHTAQPINNIQPPNIVTCATTAFRLVSYQAFKMHTAQLEPLIQPTRPVVASNDQMICTMIPLLH